MLGVAIVGFIRDCPIQARKLHFNTSQAPYKSSYSVFIHPSSKQHYT